MNQVLAELAELEAVFRPALEAACDHPVKYHETNKRDENDPWLRAYLTRDEVKHRLRRAGIKGLGFSLGSEPLGAVHLTGRGYEIRLQKAGRAYDEETKELTGQSMGRPSRTPERSSSPRSWLWALLAHGTLLPYV